MKKLLLIIMIIFLYSCDNNSNDCYIEAQRVYISVNSSENRGAGETLVVTNDLTLDGDQLWQFIVNNGGHTVNINGNLTVTNGLINDSGTFFIEGDIFIGTSLLFFDGNGLMKSSGNFTVGQAITGIGNIEYCGLYLPPIDVSTTINAEENCETLGIGQILGVGQIDKVDCNYAFDNFEKHQDEIGEYYYKKIN